MKIITCAGYYGTGSSAVTDLINECDNVHFLGEYEFRFVQDPDGIKDLEYNLVINNHRHNSGYAIKRFEKNVKFLNGNRIIKKYNRFFGNQWNALSKKYVNDLVDVEYHGYWHQDVRDKGVLIYFLDRIWDKFIHNVLHFGIEYNYPLFMRNYTNYASYPDQKFYDITKKYIDDLFNIANTDDKEFVMVDQLVPPSNVSSYLKLFNDIKVICVERDPRDLFILEKEYWNGTICPHNVDDFCKWYKATRKHMENEKDNPKQIMRIHFEDLIYHYENLAPQILKFCGIDSKHHTAKKSLLDPEKSIKNTKLFKKYPQYTNEIRVIENQLADYLYDFTEN